MRCVNLAVSAAGVLSIALSAQGGYDAIGPNSTMTNAGFWLNSLVNTDAMSDQFTACGAGVITVPAGQRVTEIQAVIGTRNPAGTGPVNFNLLSGWRVHFWSSESAFAASRFSGDVLNANYTQPANADFATPFGVDVFGRSTFLVRFRLPGGYVAPAGNAYFAVRAAGPQSIAGTVGILESMAAGPSGLWATSALNPPGYLIFEQQGFSTRNGVFAYRIVTGCGSDYDGDGAVAVADIFTFLNAWFVGEAGADFDGVDGVAVADIFGFLNQWFGGC